MSGTTAATGFYIKHPPRDAGNQIVKSANTSTSAANVAIFSGMTSPPTKKVWVTVEALTEDLYFLCKPTATTAAVTSSTGMLVATGEKADFWLNPAVDQYFDVIAAGSGKIKWYVSSPEFEGI